MGDAVKERTHNLESRLAEVGSMWVAAVHGAGGIQPWLAGTRASGAGAVAAMSTANQRPEAPAFQMERNPLSAETEGESGESVAEEEARDKEAVQVAWEEERKKAKVAKKAAKVAKKAAKKAAKEAQGAAREEARANRGH
jgi:hypothetical protein